MTRHNRGLAARSPVWRPAGTGAGPGEGRLTPDHAGFIAANLATIRAAITTAIKDAGYLHIPEGRRDHNTPAETLRLHGLD